MNAIQNIQLIQYLKNKFVHLALFLICCLGAFRIIHINHSFWLDEITTSWVVGGNFSDIFSRCWINNLSPLYYTIIYLSKMIFGYSEFSLRIPGLITGILTIPVIYKITYKLSNSQKLSLFAAFLSSIDYWLVYYSLEVRPYSFIIFLSAIHIYIFIFFLEKKNKLFYASILGSISGVIILLNYTSATLCIFELFVAIAYFSKWKKFSQNTTYGLLIYTILPIFMLLPFTTHIEYLIQNKSLLGSFIKKSDISSIFFIYPHFINYILLPLIIGFFVECFQRKDYNYNVYNLEFLLITSWYFIPIILHWLLTELDIVHIFRDRYLAWVMPAPIIGSVFLIKQFYSKYAKIAFISVLMLLAIKNYLPNFDLNFFETIFQKNYQQNINNITIGEFSWKEAVSFINKSNTKYTKIYVLPSLVESEMLNKNIHNDKLLKSYLLSTVNSIYKLNQSYLSIAEPIRSVADIPDSASNYLVIGHEATENIIKNSTEISPKNYATVHILHVR